MADNRRPLLLGGALILFLAVAVGAAVLWMNRGDRGGTAVTGSPTALPTATATAGSTESASPTPGATAVASLPTEEEALAILTEIEEQVVEIRGLPPADIGPPDLISREELRAELQRIFDEEYPAEEREQDNIALRALGLLEPGQDVAGLQLELLGEGVLGFYDDAEQRMVVVSDAGLNAEAKVTYAHEYTHALQDAAFVLDSLETDAVGEDDRGLARTSLIEGDATVTMIAWLAQHLTAAEQAELMNTTVPDTSGIPSWMVAQLEFPYTAGQFWVSQLAGGDLFAPDFTEVDAAFADPPTSTEQVIDINKWADREEPVPVDLPDLAGALGAGWEEVDATPIGQASIAIMLEFFGAGAADAGLAADGWGGDRVVIASGPDDSFALAWRLTWDAAGEAAEFTDAYETVIGGLPFPASVRSLSDGDVLVIHASNQELHDATLGAIGE